MSINQCKAGCVFSCTVSASLGQLLPPFNLWDAAVLPKAPKHDTILPKKGWNCRFKAHWKQRMSYGRAAAGQTSLTLMIMTVEMMRVTRPAPLLGRIFLLNQFNLSTVYLLIHFIQFYMFYFCIWILNKTSQKPFYVDVAQRCLPIRIFVKFCLSIAFCTILDKEKALILLIFDFVRNFQPIITTLYYFFCLFSFVFFLWRLCRAFLSFLRHF